MNMVICPYCEQDYVWPVSIDGFGQEVYRMCFECDTIWGPDEQVINGTGCYFKLFMERLGKKPDWSVIRKKSLLEDT